MQAASKPTEQATAGTELPREELDAVAFEASEPMRARLPAANGNSHPARTSQSSPISLGGWTWPIPRPDDNKA